jgi:hypothetical protein
MMANTCIEVVTDSVKKSHCRLIYVSSIGAQDPCGMQQAPSKTWVCCSMECALVKLLERRGRVQPLERWWLGFLDEGFVTVDPKNVECLNKFIALLSRAGYARVAIFAFKFRSTSIVAHNMEGNMVITHLISAPKMGVHLNDATQLLGRTAGVKLAETREKFVGFTAAKVLMPKTDIDQILAGEGLEHFLFSNLSPSEPKPGSDLVKLFIEGRFSEQYKVLQGKKARSCGRAGTELLTNMQCGACESERPYCKAPARASLAAVVAPTSSPASTSRAHGMLLPISFYFGASRCVYMYFTMSCSG